LVRDLASAVEIWWLVGLRLSMFLLGVGKNPQTDSNRIIQTEKWLSGRVAADRRVVSQTFSVVDGLKWTSSVF
jgi:hypothetical protein